jgi:hypothetical protein
VDDTWSRYLTRREKEKNDMTEWTEREGELEARATEAGLTLIRPPAGRWVIIYGHLASWDAVNLDEAEEITEANEPGDGPGPVNSPRGPLPGVPWTAAGDDI